MQIFQHFDDQKSQETRGTRSPLNQATTGFGDPVTLQASLTVCPSSAVQSVNTASKSGGPVEKHRHK